MPVLNQPIDHIIRVTVVATGAPVTGLTTTDFTVLIRRLVNPPGGDLIADSAAFSITQIDAGVSPGLYTYRFTPATGAGRHRSDLDTVNAAYQVDVQIWEDDVVAGVVPVSGPYLTTLDNFKVATNESGTDDDQMISALLPAVTAYVQNYCGRLFFRASYVEYLDGHCYPSLVLREFPVASITTVHLSTAIPRAYGSTQLLIDGTDYLLEDEDAGVVTALSHSWFPEGPRVLRVEYIGGYAAIPADLERAAIEIMSVKLQRGKGQNYGVQSENRGDGTISYFPAITAHDVPLTAKGTLDGYVSMRQAA